MNSENIVLGVYIVLQTGCDIIFTHYFLNEIPEKQFFLSSLKYYPNRKRNNGDLSVVGQEIKYGYYPLFYGEPKHFSDGAADLLKCIKTL